MLERVAEDIWVVHRPNHRFVGLKIGTRMTVVRLGEGSVLLHSPVAIDAQLANELDALGEVTHIIAPNKYHHVYAGPAQQRYPKAMLHASGALRKKRKDLRIDRVLDETPHPDWHGLTPVSIAGCLLAETVLVHGPSRTVIASDLTENFTSMDDAMTRVYLKASGIYQRPGWSRLMRVVYRDHKAARRSIDKLLDHDFDRAVIAHGDVIESGAKDAVRSTFGFLRA